MNAQRKGQKPKPVLALTPVVVGNTTVRGSNACSCEPNAAVGLEISSGYSRMLDRHVGLDAISELL
jgi:hypothetical protein